MTDALSASGTVTPPPDTTAPSVPIAPGTSTGPTATIGRLTRIELENYRAYRGSFVIDISNGENLVVYGENGAGKSSLFNAIIDFLESPEKLFFDHNTNKSRALTCEDFRHRFNTDPSVVRLTFMPPDSINGKLKVYEWSALKNDPKSPKMRDVDKGKGCFDYRSLLRVHLLRRGQQELNLFELFINPIMAHHKNALTNVSFSNEWKGIANIFAPYVRKPSNLQERMDKFNAGFERAVKDTVALAAKYLLEFDRELAVDVDFTPASYSWSPKKLIPPKIVAKPVFKKLLQKDYHSFLNEARLSAIAIALYLAGLKKSPAVGERLLLLDDVLIGLDMAHRMTVLRILEKYFKDWQVFIFTYSKAWFEILKSRTNLGEWGHSWKYLILRLIRSLGIEFPIVATESGSLLKCSREHLNYGDFKAAAVYARSAWESLMSWYCCGWHLPVSYVESRRELDTNAFLSSISSHLEKIRDGSDREWARGILQEIRHARRFVLNPHSHYDPEIEDEISAEIAQGIRAVEDFEVLLRCLRRNDYQTEDDELNQISSNELLCNAIDHYKGNRKCAAIHALSGSFEQHLDQLLRFHEAMVPYGYKINRYFLFKWVGKLKFFKPLTWKRLRHAQPYLLGTILPRYFDQSDFEAAVRLLLRIRLAFLLQEKIAKP